MVARAFGADRIIVCGNEDLSMKKSVDSISKHWGGKFKIEFVNDWKKELTKLHKQGFVSVHLTMYGEPIMEKEEEISKNNKVCVIIGSQKVERAVYNKATYNISITNQPHSEIAALAVTLDRLQNGKELAKKFIGREKEIVPQARSKKVISLK